MSIPLPNLDDRAWEDLRLEGLSLIPSNAPEWTDYNASDPGITLMELLAHFAEILIYRTNRISSRNQEEFLALLDPGNRGSDTEQVISNLRRVHRAISAPDFENLALASNPPHPHPNEELVARAVCVPGRNLAHPDPAARALAAPGHISLIVVPNRPEPPSQPLLWRVKDFLEPARLLTTQLHVVPPRYLSAGIRITLVIEPDAEPEKVRAYAAEALETFFDPLEGSPDTNGWPAGRHIYVSEIYRLLQTVPGVDFVTATPDPVSGHLLDEVIASPDRVRRNHAGELEAVTLDPDELVSAVIDPKQISIRKGSEIVP